MLKLSLLVSCLAVSQAQFFNNNNRNNNGGFGGGRGGRFGGEEEFKGLPSFGPCPELETMQGFDMNRVG